MLFHEALHLVFTTFSRQVLQQGRLTNYLADCGVFDIFDDRRTICLTIDQHFGVRLFDCLSHSPYKQQFDAMVTEAKQLHPAIDPQQVEYVFQSIRFAWGKIKSVRPPKPPVLFAPPKKKRSRQLPIAHRPSPKKQRGAGGRPTPKKRQRRPASPPYTLHPTPSNNPSPKKRPRQLPIANNPSPIANNQSSKMRQQGNARVILYLFALVFAFCACILFNSHHGDIGAFCLLAAGICSYAIYKYLK